jgi:hypothetical protein
MKFRRLQLVCECGHRARIFQAVGFTAEYELVIHWTCNACRKQSYLVKSLADCCKQVPDLDDPYGLLKPIPGPDGSPHTAAEDARFLQSLGIRP